MKNLKTSKYLLDYSLLTAMLVFTLEKASTQDFILTKNNELFECKITIDSPTYIQYKRNTKVYLQQKSTIADYSIVSNVKPGIVEIMDKQGLRLRGTFLFADTDSVYFWRGLERYNPTKGSFLAIGLDQIEWMVIYQKADFSRGFVVGGILGLLYGVSIADDWGEHAATITFGSAATFGLFGGLIGGFFFKRFQFDDPQNELPKIRNLTRKNAMLLTRPIKSIGRDTTLANWISEELTLYKSKAKKRERK